MFGSIAEWISSYINFDFLGDLLGTLWSSKGQIMKNIAMDMYLNQLRKYLPEAVVIQI